MGELERIKREYHIEDEENAEIVQYFKMKELVELMKGNEMTRLLRSMGMSLEQWVAYQHEAVKKKKEVASVSISPKSEIPSSPAMSSVPEPIDTFEESVSEGDALEFYMSYVGINAKDVLDIYGPRLSEDALMSIAIEISTDLSKEDENEVVMLDNVMLESVISPEAQETIVLEEALKASSQTLEAREQSELEQALQNSLKSKPRSEDDVIAYQYNRLMELSRMSASSSSGSQERLSDMDNVITRLGLNPEAFRRLKMRDSETAQFESRVQKILEVQRNVADYEDRSQSVFHFYKHWQEEDFSEEFWREQVFSEDERDTQGASVTTQTASAPKKKKNKKNNKNKIKKKKKG